MARVFTTGFEFGDLLDVTVVTGCTIVTSPVRTGTYAIRLTTGHVFSVGLASAAEYYVKCYFRFAVGGAATKIIYWTSGGTELGSIRFNASNKIDLYNSTSNLAASGVRALSIDTWYLIEVRIKVDDATGVIEVKVDGAADATFRGDTKPGAQTTIDAVIFTDAMGGSNNYFYFDDIAIDGAAYPGDGRVIRLGPNGNGDVTQMLGSDGNQTDNYLLVDEVPHNSDADYVYETVVDKYDLYALADTGLSNVAITRVWAEARAQGAAGDNLAMVLKINGTEYQSADIALPTSYGRVIEAERTTNPDTAASWTTGDLDALQAGPKVR